MKKSLPVLFLAVAMVAMLFSSTAFAGVGWKVPKNVRIVQQSNTGANRTFDTIDGALASITDASAIKPYLVTVKPGIYVQTAALDVPSHVTIEGSGVENTVITSAIPIGDTRLYGRTSDSPDATVIMNDQTAIRNVTVSNTSDQGGVAILVHGVVTVEDVVADARGTGVGTSYHDYGAIFAENAGTFLTVRDVVAHAESLSDGPGFGDALAISAFRGAIADVSDVKAFAGGGAYAVGLSADYDVSSIHIRNSYVEVSNTVGGRAIEGQNGSTVTNTVVWSTDTAVWSVDTIIGSEIHGAQEALGGQMSNVAATMIDGPITSSGTTLVHCWDAEFAPIPDTL